MTNLKRITKNYREAGAVNGLVNISTALDEKYFSTKSGGMFSMVQLGGVDYEGLDPAQIDMHCRMFESASRSFDSYRIYQYMVKSDCGPVSGTLYPAKPVLNQAVQSRSAQFNSRKTLMADIQLYMAVAEDQPAKRSRSLMEALSLHDRMSNDFRGQRQACEKLEQKLNSFAVQMSGSLNPVAMNKQEQFAFFRHMLNLDPRKTGVRLKDDLFVDFQLCGSAIECHQSHLRVGDRFVKILTLKDPPPHTISNMLRSLLEIPAEFIVASEWKPEANDHVLRAINSKQRHFHNKKHSPMAAIGGNSTNSSDYLVDDSSVAMVRAFGECLTEIEVHGNVFGTFSMTILLHDLDYDRLQRSVGQCLKVFAAFDSQLIEETYNSLNAYQALLPGGHAFNHRRIWLSNTNYADLSFLFRLDIGEKFNKHLGEEHLALLETNHGSPYFFNFHYGDVAHALMVGSSGSGKSFALNFFITHAQKYDPQVFIFEIGGSYRTITSKFGGTYLPLAASNWRFTINPFQSPPKPENLQFLLQLILVLASSNGYAPTAEDEKDIFNQIKSLYEIAPAQRKLSTLVNILGRRLRVELEKWVRPGPYGELFDNAEDTLTFSKFQAFDFEGLKDSPMLEPFLFSVLHRASATILDTTSPRAFKMFVMDEVWRFVQNPTIRAYILDAVRTWRKKNASIILATQSVEDLNQSQLLGVLVENCPTKLFLANPGMDQNVYRSVFHLTETEAQLVANLTPKRQLLLKRPDVTKVLNLEVSPEEHLLYATSASSPENPESQMMPQNNNKE